MNRGDIYLVSLDPALGHEQQGMRPVVIVSPDAFNALGTPLVVPITTGGAYARARGLTVSLSAAGLKTTGVVLCHQPRALDIAARSGRRIESVPGPILEEILNKLLALFE